MQCIHIVSCFTSFCRTYIAVNDARRFTTLRGRLGSFEQVVTDSWMMQLQYMATVTILGQRLRSTHLLFTMLISHQPISALTEGVEEINQFTLSAEIPLLPK